MISPRPRQAAKQERGNDHPTQKHSPLALGAIHWPLLTVRAVLARGAVSAAG